MWTSLWLDETVIRAEEKWNDTPIKKKTTEVSLMSVSAIYNKHT